MAPTPICPIYYDLCFHLRQEMFENDAAVLYFRNCTQFVSVKQFNYSYNTESKDMFVQSSLSLTHTHTDSINDRCAGIYKQVIS